jgi:serine/threonine protein kinase
MSIHPGIDVSGSPTAGEPPTRDEEDYWEQLVNRLFCQDDDSPGRSFNLRSQPAVLLPGRLARAELSLADDPTKIFEAYLVKGVGPGIAPMWNRQMRSLLRLRALGHPGLPELYMGKYDSDERVAYAVTTLRGRSLAEAGHRWRDDERLQAVEQFAVLVDALGQLHSIGIHHRNIHLDAIRVDRDDEADDQYRCQLSRFEVSGLVRGLMGMQSSTVDANAHTAMREMTLRPPEGASMARHLAGLAPELFPYLFGDTATLRTDAATTDVFGLGVIGWEWFCGPIEEVLPEEYQRLAYASGDERRAAVEDLQQQMRRHLSRAAIPKQLAGVLRDMIDRDPGARATAFEATAALSASWPALQVTFDERDRDQALLLGYMPKESGRTVWELFEWIDHDPAGPEGQKELEELLERDLRRAELIHVPGGARGYVRSAARADAQRQAEWVLIGERALWFAGYLREPRHDDPPNPHVLVVRFVLEKESGTAARLLRVLPRRLVGRLRLVPYKPGQALGVDATACPSWQPLADPLRRREKEAGREFLQSIDFLQEYLETQLRARWYPYERLPGTDQGRVLVKHDRKRDRERAKRDERLEAYLAFPRARPTLGDFVDNLGGGGELPTLVVGHDRDGRPSFRDGVRASVTSQADRDVVILGPVSGAAIPARGWLRAQEDVGTDIQLDRQAKARRLLDDRPGLIDQLTSPRAVDVAVEFIDDSFGTGLDGDDAYGIVRDICTVEPLYALQGPPGTGKSTIATTAIVKYLSLQPYTRLLVSAQSNDALNSIGAKIIASVDRDEVVVVRATSKGSPVEDDVVGEYTLDKLQERYRATIKGSVRARLAHGGSDDLRPDSPEDALLKRWMSRVDGNVVELGERLRRAAQITLATCSTSALVLDYSRDGAAVFDWVLVEEAAKAWPNELLIPLVQGLRWTLIGDHRQLGAHRGDDLERFLDFLAQRGTEGAQRHARLKEQHLRFLNLFASMFTGLDGGPTEEATGNETSGGAPRALNRLVHQFRMHPDIAEMVGRAFYPTSTDEKAREQETGLPTTILDSSYVSDLGHQLTEPAYLARQSLIWLNTAEVSACGDEPSWFNLGEAKLVADLAAQLDTPRNRLSLAVLSPYRRQLDKIQELAPKLKGRLHTVHSFQGSEADQVLVSLVRHEHRGESIQANLGFLAQDEIINVMLSRARRLLVVVGNIEHFRAHGDRNWQDVIRGFEHYGKVETVGRDDDR